MKPFVRISRRRICETRMNRIASPTMPPPTKAMIDSSTVHRAAHSRFDKITQKLKSAIVPQPFGNTSRPTPRRMARVTMASIR